MDVKVEISNLNNMMHITRERPGICRRVAAEYLKTVQFLILTPNVQTDLELHWPHISEDLDFTMIHITI